MKAKTSLGKYLIDRRPEVLPGDVLHLDISSRTLRRYKALGWICDIGRIVLTVKGWREAK